MYDTEDGWIALNHDNIAMICNMRKDRAKKVVITLLEKGKFIVSGDRISNVRVQKEFIKCADLAQTAARNAHKRWSGDSEKSNENNKPDMRKQMPDRSGSKTNHDATRDQIPEKKIVSNETNAREGISNFELIPSDVKTAWLPNAFDLFWSRYPHKVSKGDARKAFDVLRKKPPLPLPDMLEALDRYVATKPSDRAYCNPATWLRGERWLDAPDTIPITDNRPVASDSLRAASRRIIEDERRAEQADTGMAQSHGRYLSHEAERR